jgi:hypothetical protein
MDISELLNSPAGKSIVEKMSAKLGMDKKQAAKAVNTAIPVILGGLNRNLKTPEGAESLNRALESKHDGSLLDNLSDILQGNSDELVKDGEGILGHVFGSDVNVVQQGIAQKTGISMDKAGPLLSSLAPVVMAYLGKQKKQTNAGAGGLGDLLGGLLGSVGTKKKQSGGILGMITGLLDKDKDGSAVDDILEMLTKK